MTACVFIHFQRSPALPALLALTRRHAGERALAPHTVFFAPHVKAKACQVIFLEHGSKRIGINAWFTVKRRYLKLSFDCDRIILRPTSWIPCAFYVPTPSLFMIKHGLYDINTSATKNPCAPLSFRLDFCLVGRYSTACRPPTSPTSVEPRLARSSPR
jgi:hypothetical protein